MHGIRQINTNTFRKLDTYCGPIGARQQESLLRAICNSEALEEVDLQVVSCKKIVF